MAKAPKPQNIVRDGPDSLVDAARSAGKGHLLPPVHLWNPPDCGDIDIRIARDGTWHHEGRPIGRPQLVRLFSTILRKDDDRFVLVTPVEKLGIVVEDAPFVAVDVDAEGGGAAQRLTFETNLGDRVTAGPDHPIRVALDPETGEPAPYVVVRAALEARIDRKTYYRLAELGRIERHGGADWFGIRSGGCFFPVMPASDLG